MSSFNPINWEVLPIHILNAIESAKEEHGWNNIGIRIQGNHPFEVGPIEHVSSVWVDGEETSEELPGICAISATDMDKLCKCAAAYLGDHVAIIAGDIVEYGEDPCEVVLSNAEVVEVLA